MHVVIVGAGAVGTLYGGWLRASGLDVSFLARGAALSALRTEGPVLRGDRGDQLIGPVTAHDDPGALAPADVIIMTVKLYDLREAALAAAPLLADGGLVVGLQNGVSAFDILSETFAPEQIMVGPVYSAARLSAPCVVDYTGARHLAVIGNPAGNVHPAAGMLVEGWRRAGIEAEISDDIGRVLWMKFLGFATNAALTCLSRQSAGVVYHDPDLLDLTRASIREIAAVSKAQGMTLPADAEEITLRLLQSFPPDMVASMRQDLDAGRRLELDDIIGTIVRLGRCHNIPTPVHAAAYACLKPYRHGAASPSRRPSHATA